MCGIAGLIAQGSQAELERLATAMASAIAYRGPDGAGVWADAEAGVALSHRRLAIVDLTPTGAQPMATVEDQVVRDVKGIADTMLLNRGQKLAPLDLGHLGDERGLGVLSELLDVALLDLLRLGPGHGVKVI